MREEVDDRSMISLIGVFVSMNSTLPEFRTNVSRGTSASHQSRPIEPNV